MKLLRLRVTAFGPFAGTEEVDFAGLGEAGLFLIQGPTGAGKTSVLDAVCFALFGTVPGARKRIRNLRSDHAAQHVAPEVVLEFEAGARRWRVTRSPEWQRPKQRGSGTTRQHAAVALQEWRDGGWAARSTRIDETAEEIERLLGMNAAQFAQVALLPQGEFAAFLRSGAEERRAVLEKLFATELYAAVEKYLADERARTRREAETLEQRFHEGAGLVAEVAEREVPEEADAAALLDWADALAAEHTEGLTGAAARLAAARETVTTAQRAHTAARELALRQREFVQETARKAELDARAQDVQRERARLETAERAEKVRPYGSAVAARGRQVEGAEARVAEARRAVAVLVPPAPLPCVCAAEGCRCADLSADAPVAAVAGALRVWQGELARLDVLSPRQTRLEEVTRETRVLRERENQHRAAEEKAGLRLAELPEAIEADRAALEDAKLNASLLESASRAVADAHQAVEDARRRDQLQGQLAKAGDASRAAVDAAQEATDVLQRVRRARLDGMAALLAADLRDGEACRVCGSTSHPAPADGAADVPSDADEARAAAVQEKAQRAREEAAMTVESLRAQYDGLLERVEAPVSELADSLAAARADLDAKRRRAGRVEELQARLTAVEQELEQARAAQGEAARQVADAAAALRGLADEEVRLRAELDAARGTDATLEARVTRLTREAELLAEAGKADTRAAAAREQLAQAAEEFAHAWAEQGFATAEETRAALLTEPERARRTAEIRAFDDALAAVTDRLAAPELVAAAAQEPPDVAGLEAAAREAEEAHAALVSAHDRAARLSTRLTELAAELRARNAAWEPARAAYETTARLASVVNGQPPNPAQMRLSAYVLSARLDQVVGAANARLTTMSQSRYLLRRTDERSAADSKRNSGGLGLRVTDSWTGQDRDPATLSGGESFITSLALALGLADVVTAEAGGAEINTLFVDEGFGTLDEDTLDEVMTVLDSLRDGNRTVGVVSHVAELRTRIPTQLRLTKTRSGSRLTTTL
ncbi:SMC family ATPase [Actinocorallia sp. API 0066]|uniref:AAA family ATPase n=1 Tax=Actinocorallia sp. API 0066 TaxID=2896846 RepID=UPI001E4C85F7|nr:SMC family ATPase [Actinocorallia sp. API 0066]MCD0448597.1 SMC family ATPase [Actinocorallia sp. API 0066]